jgi:NADH-quinone oxidoreductase subunit A
VALDLLNVYMPVVILLVVGVLAVPVTLLIGRLIRPAKPSKLKETAYECGELPIGAAWSSFNIRFYVIGLVFIIFDVESALMFPVVAVFNKFNGLGMGGLVLAEVLIFLLILIAGLAYCWRRGDLDWVKSYSPSNRGDSGAENE